ncbi:HlyD family type I secretion periplasmic adaptor subunit, partial [Hydrogenophaga sp.]|uniref:HlyD family type I secretion periplasmic adaptor subunit n=1 Tax=Hydrogenophaga sp. TaxID=1904254 RepID=UPI003AF79F09
PLIRLQQQAPSPIGRRVLWCLLALLVFLIVWASVGRLDIVAVAEGKLVPEDYLKIVQPSEAGIVSAILVREGQTVQKDQVLMRMDALTTDTDLSALTTERGRKRLALRRVDAELAEQRLKIDADELQPLAQEALAQQLANEAALASALAEERSRMLKAQQELAAAQQQSQRLQAVLPHFQAQETAYAQLADQGFTGQLMVSDKRRERIEKEQELATQQHVIASARASIDQSVKKLEQIQAEHRQRLHTERAETRSQLERLEADWQKQQHRRALMELRAPHEGIVKELATHTVGTVVQPGTVLATLVPQQAPLKVEVWIANDDVGFVRPGQSVKLKFAAYPFQKYGMAHGDLQWVNADAQTEEPGRSPAPDGALPPPLRYKATVSLRDAALVRDDRRHELTAGMQAQAEILLGQRTVMQYLLSPVQRAWHEAGRER